MTQLIMNIEGNALPGPLEFQDTIEVTMTTNDYAASSTGQPRLSRGFNIKSATAGTWQVITLAQWYRKLADRTSGIAIADPFKISDGERNDILQAIAADADEGKQNIPLAANEWNTTPLVFVEKSGAPVATFSVGII